MAVFLADRVPARDHRPALPPVLALTIAATAIISAINAVTLKPAQCAVYLRPTRERKNCLLLSLVQRRLRPLRAASMPRSSRRAGPAHGLPMMTWCLRRSWSAVTGWWFTQAADRVPAHRGPGVRDHGSRSSPTPPRRNGPARSSPRSGDPQEDARRFAGWFMIGGNSLLDGARATQRGDDLPGPGSRSRSDTGTLRTA